MKKWTFIKNNWKQQIIKKKKMNMIQQEHFEKNSLQKLKIRMSASPERRPINFDG